MNVTLGLMRIGTLQSCGHIGDSNTHVVQDCWIHLNAYGGSGTSPHVDLPDPLNLRDLLRQD